MHNQKIGNYKQLVCKKAINVTRLYGHRKVSETKDLSAYKALRHTCHSHVHILDQRHA